jgi:sugar/nucleoside kinase (ribokinase family)
MSYEGKRRCGSVEFRSRNVSSKARLDDIKDLTGAGDAFWTGFLYAQLLNKILSRQLQSRKISGVET